MEKYILRWSYWLGVISLAVALVWRVVIVLAGHVLEMRGITYMSAFKAGLLFLSVAVATTCYAWFKTHKP